MNSSINSSVVDIVINMNYGNTFLWKHIQPYLPWKGMQTITKVRGQVEELVNARMKYPRLHVITLLLVLSAKTFHNF